MKKTIALLLVAVMALSLTSAFASSPKNYEEPVTVVTPTPAAPAAPAAPAEEVEEEVEAENLVVAVVESEAVDEAVEEIKKMVAEEKPVIEYFPEETQEEVKAVLPETVKAEDLELNEFVGMAVDNFEQVVEEADEVRVIIAFTTKYDPEQEVFPLIGLVDEAGNVTWVLIEAEVQEDGSLMLIIPTDVLEKMGNAASVQVAILSTPQK